jgi:hypothetical protein
VTPPGAGTAVSIPTAPAGPPWTYVVAHEAAWAAAAGFTPARPTIHVHHESYREDGSRDGAEWQFEVAWPDGRLTVEWEGFEECVQLERPDLVEALYDLRMSTPPDVVLEVLGRHGFVDVTDRAMPRPRPVVST